MKEIILPLEGPQLIEKGYATFQTRLKASFWPLALYAVYQHNAAEEVLLTELTIGLKRLAFSREHRDEGKINLPIFLRELCLYAEPTHFLFEELERLGEVPEGSLLRATIENHTDRDFYVGLVLLGRTQQADGVQASVQGVTLSQTAPPKGAP